MVTGVLSLVLMAQMTEAGVLGGPCLDEKGADPQVWLQAVSRYRNQTPEAAIATAKEIVRGRCSNEHWRFELIELLTEQQQFEAATVLLDAFAARGSNAIHDRLADATPRLKPLLTSEAFRKSAIASKLRQEEADAVARRARALEALKTLPGPGKRYLARNACPFECCRFGTWTSKGEVILYESPGGGKPVAKIAKGAKVTALTGQLRVTPAPVLVRFDQPEGFSARVGSIVYLLDPIGEGFGHIWMNGRIVEGGAAWVRQVCRAPNAQCWGEFVNVEDARRAGSGDWWVRVKTADGKIGWTKQAAQFDGVDGCG